MKKLLCMVAAAGAVACHSTPAGTRGGGPVSPGAPTASGAVHQFLDATHAGDLQAMSFVWGTVKGPSVATMDRNELEKREVILQCYFNADSYRILDESRGADGRRVFRVRLTHGTLNRTTTVITVRGPSERWYVENLDIAAVRDFCSSGRAAP